MDIMPVRSLPQSAGGLARGAFVAGLEK